jgi:putative Mg2+ transporter-C (MgtC) family protein
VIDTWFQDVLNVITPLGTAAFLGASVGWERETVHKAAGLRTNMIVSLGAATFTLLAFRAIEGVAFTGDPSRIIQGVATGIGFLGAGSIVHSRGEVSGVTTAAGIWLVGAIGAGCGAGHYDIAIVAVLLGFGILALLQRLSSRISKENGPRND